MSNERPRGVLILPNGPLSARNKRLKALYMAHGWSIEFVGGEDEPYQGTGLFEPVYYDECPEDFPEPEPQE